VKIFYLALLFVLVGCDVSEPLGGGYVYATTDSRSNGIYKGNRVFVFGYIRKYKVYGNYIIGEKSVLRSSEKYWFFIVNKEKSEYIDNIPEGMYQELLLKIKSEDLDWGELKSSGVDVLGVRKPEIIYK